VEPFVHDTIESNQEEAMTRFTVGARVRVAEEKSTGRVGTVVEVLTSGKPAGAFDHYRVEFNDGTVEELQDLQLAPAGSGPTFLEEDAA
jgi:hypothetical protein